MGVNVAAPATIFAKFSETQKSVKNQNVVFLNFAV
jgi:hypothetical protein